MTGMAARAEAGQMENEMVRRAGPGANKAGREGCSMRKRIRGILLLPVALACLLGISSCGNGGTITVTSVTISPASATVQINEQVEFTAQVALSNTTDTSTTTTIVTWYVNGVAGGNTSIGTIQTSTLDAERAVLQLQTRRLQASVDLVRALGGGWDASELAGAEGAPAPKPAS